MTQPLSRRQVLTHGAAACSALALGALIIDPATASAQDPPPAKPQVRERPPRLDSELVRDFVAAAHGKFDKVKEMLEKQAKLVNSTWDWGGGDFETALGGAAHMGRKDIATYLLEKGARMDIFAAAMLGKLEVVKAAIVACPGTEKVPGPHGIPLLAHAKAGKEDAAEVVKYLESLKSA